MPSPMMNTLVRDHPRLNVPACQASRMRSRKLEGNAPPLTNRKTQRRTVKTATPVFFAAFDTDNPLPISLRSRRIAARVRSWRNCAASWSILSKRMSKEADPIFPCFKKAQNGYRTAQYPAKLRQMRPILRQPYVSVASTSHPYHPGVGSDSLNVALGSIRGGLFSWLATGGVRVACGVPDLAVRFTSARSYTKGRSLVESLIGSSSGMRFECFRRGAERHRRLASFGGRRSY